jgi:hypothetical protein
MSSCVFEEPHHGGRLLSSAKRFPNFSLDGFQQKLFAVRALLEGDSICIAFCFRHSSSSTYSSEASIFFCFSAAARSSQYRGFSSRRKFPRYNDSVHNAETKQCETSYCKTILPILSWGGVKIALAAAAEKEPPSLTG